MQIIDGYCNEPNIFADDIGEYNTAIWGTRDCVLPAGERLDYELVSNNEIKIKDGVFSTQGRRGVIKKGTTESCIIENGTQAENRNDLLVIEYSKDSSTLVESHTLKVLKGIPGETATDPSVITGDIAAGAVLHQMPLYRVKLEGLNIVAVEQMFTIGSIAVETADPMSADKQGTPADAKLTGDALRQLSTQFTDKLDAIEAYIKGGYSMTIGNVLYEAGTAATAVTKELETTSPSLIYLDHCASYTVTANGSDVNAKAISKQGSYNRNSAIAILPKGNISITFKGTAQTGAGCTLFELSL